MIPSELSIRYAKEAGSARLHLIDGDHALNGSLEVVAGWLVGFLSQVTDKMVAVSESAEIFED